MTPEKTISTLNAWKHTPLISKNTVTVCWILHSQKWRRVALRAIIHIIPPTPFYQIYRFVALHIIVIVTFETEANASFEKGSISIVFFEMGSRKLRIVYFIGPSSSPFHLRSFCRRKCAICVYQGLQRGLIPSFSHKPDFLVTFFTVNTEKR